MHHPHSRHWCNQILWVWAGVWFAWQGADSPVPKTQLRRVTASIYVYQCHKVLGKIQATSWICMTAHWLLLATYLSLEVWAMAQQARPVLALLLLCCAIPQTVAAGAAGHIIGRLSRHQHTQLEEFLQQTLQCRNVPGITLTLVSEHKTLLSRGYGKADIDKDVDVTNETLFCVASLTKAFTSTLLGLLFQNSR